MSSVITEFAPAKINLALHILGRRADGYHALDSVVAFADVGDVLTLTPSLQTKLSVDGPFLTEVPTDPSNLVLKAHGLLAEEVPLPPVAMHLTKNLPVASGIGGGSADAAAALRGLLRLANASLPDATLQKLALQLGADVPVCLRGKCCRMQGVGEVITPLAEKLPPAMVLANPLMACSTADVFRTMGLQPGDHLGSALNPETPATWRNDMTTAAIKVLPVISDVLQALQELPNADAVRMSGSGATCFALFQEYTAAQQAAELLQQRQPQWWVKAAKQL